MYIKIPSHFFCKELFLINCVHRPGWDRLKPRIWKSMPSIEINKLSLLIYLSFCMESVSEANNPGNGIPRRDKFSAIIYKASKFSAIKFTNILSWRCRLYSPISDNDLSALWIQNNLFVVNETNSARKKASDRIEQLKFYNRWVFRYTKFRADFNLVIPTFLVWSSSK